MKAECVWGDGPDVIVSLEGTPVMLYEHPEDFEHFPYGEVRQGSFDLTAAEAEKLARELLTAAAHVRSLEQSLQSLSQEEK